MEHEKLKAMPEEQSHPLYQKPQEPKPDETSSETEKAKPVMIPIPGAVKTPYLSYILIFINLALFALRYLNPEIAQDILNAGVLHSPSILREKEFYRLFTSMFLHLNETHLIFNMLALYYIGSYIERMFGHLRFAIIYFAGGLLGAILPLFFSDLGLGASGAIFAVWAAEAVFLYRHRQLFGAMGQARLKNSLYLMGMNFIFGIIVNLAGSVAGASVAIGNVAHFGGLVGGAIISWLIAPRFFLRQKASTQAGEAHVEILQINPLEAQISNLLVYAIALALLLLLAVYLRA